MRKYIVLILTLVSTTLSAQYVTLDKDGYTNIRKNPNAKSEIVETVKKYQVFYSAQDIPCYGDDDVINDVGNWLRVSTDMENPTGYIYKKNLYPVNNLPALANEVWVEGNEFNCSNDSIKVNITLQAYNTNNKIEGKKTYGTDGWTPYKEIREISVNYKDKKVTIPENKFKNYYDIGYVTVWIGFDGELYILISGGDGSGGYSVMLSVVNGDILYALSIEC